jgi:sugar O-acyltransferase (sialic acid O-acetyltransferase NeuD family)
MIKALIGFGGHAREVMAQMGLKLTCFVDDKFITGDCLPLSSFDPERYCVMVAIANSKDRFDVVQRLPKNTKFFTFIHPTALVMENVEIEEGSFIGAYSILTTNIKIGKHTLLNRGNQIGHDCEIGDYFSAMPGAIVSGNVKIGNLVYMGTNSAIKQKLFVCSDVTIGSNAAVVKHIQSNGTYVGVPVKLLNNLNNKNKNI